MFRKAGSIFFCFCLMFSASFCQVEIRPFSVVYAENLHGGTAMFGNTIMEIIDNGVVNLDKMNQSGDPSNLYGGIGFSQYGNDGENMVGIDIDQSDVTRNSSQADLILPAGTNNIKFARLYWGGRINSSLVNATLDTLRQVKIRSGRSGRYINIYASQTNVDKITITSEELAYQSYADITDYVRASGAGSYTVGDIPVTYGSVQNGGRFGGWTIVVAYENAAEPMNTIRIYDGYAQVFNSGIPATLSITLTGLNVPATPLLSNEALLSTMAWEGDANLGATSSNPAGDFIKINNVAVSNAINPVTNFWNGSISKNGQFVHSKNPDYYNQMGIDIDEVEVGTGYNIAPNSTSVNIQFGTEADQYFPSIFTFVIRVKEPLVELTKTVSDANQNNLADANEELTYTLSGGNSGAGISYNTFITDTIPVNVTYVPNSMQVISAPGVTPGFKTDIIDSDIAFFGTDGSRKFVKFFIGTGATNSTGGDLIPGITSNYSIQFKVKTGSVPSTVINTARIFGYSFLNDLYTDDGTAVIGTAGGPLPVKIISLNAAFTGSTSSVIKWKTEEETGIAYYEIQSSDDGIHFIHAGLVTGTLSRSYTFNDIVGDHVKVKYYKLRIIDKDGGVGYSSIVSARRNNEAGNFMVYPNPFTTDIKILLKTDEDQVSEFRIYAPDGKLTNTRIIQLRKGENIVVIKDLGNLPAGNYFLETNIYGNKITRKIIKK